MSFTEKALRRPYTYIVLAILIVLVGVVSAIKTPTDVFPNIDIPVASVIWTYSGATPDVMEKRIVYYAERSYSSSVNDIEHMESQSMPGISIIKIYLHPGAGADAAIAQITATSQNVLKLLPPGITPPLIIRFSASNVPVLQIGVSSPDRYRRSCGTTPRTSCASNCAAVQGSAIPSPYGGTARVIMVDLDPQQLQARGLTPLDVANAVNVQNVILPTGTAKMGDREYTVSLNSSPTELAALGQVPIKVVNGGMVHIGDVGQVYDGAAVQTNIVDKDGSRRSS